MSFIHGYLLAGLVLVGLPVLIHLLMQQKPRLLPFPAFRFLKQKQFTNRRKIRLQHWLLMALRMLLIAVLLLGLARPRLAGSLFPKSWRSWLASGIDRPVVAVFVFDTSWSMDYRVDNQSRLDQARGVALQLLRDLPDGAQLLVLDTGEEATDNDWISAGSQIRSRLSQLRLRPVAVPLLRLVEQARKMLLHESKQESAPLPLLYVFSDRTRTSWTGGDGLDLHSEEETTNPIRVTYLDLGVEEPADVSIDSIRIEPEVVTPGQQFSVLVTVRATGMEYRDQVRCVLDTSNELPQHQPLELQTGHSVQVAFSLIAPREVPNQGKLGYGFQQLTVQLSKGDNQPFTDALPYNNQAYGTVLIRNDARGTGRKLLILAENPDDTVIWQAALEARARFAPADSFEVKLVPLNKAEGLQLAELKPYPVVCLFQAVSPPNGLWDTLRDYVKGGGGLCIIPAGQEIDQPKLLNEFNKMGTIQPLLPAQLEALETRPKDSGITWTGFDSNHPLLRPFQEWSRGADPDFAKKDFRPYVNRYWRVRPETDSTVIVKYTDRDGSPALVERSLGQGRVLLFTIVPGRTSFRCPGEGYPAGNAANRIVQSSDREWTNYWGSSFGYLLLLKSLGYLAGDGATPELNRWAGQTITVPLPADTNAGAFFRLEGGNDADLTDSERTLLATREGNDLAPLVLPQLNSAGNFRVLDRLDQSIAAFSLNIRPEESQLDRLPEEAIEKVLGSGVVVRPTPELRLADTVEGNQPSPIELLPLLMLLMLLALTFEGTLANRFSRRGHLPVAGPNSGGNS